MYIQNKPLRERQTEQDIKYFITFVNLGWNASYSSIQIINSPEKHTQLAIW